jgi:hypothetical protein
VRRKSNGFFFPAGSSLASLALPFLCCGAMASTKATRTQLVIVAGLASAASISLLLYYLSKQRKLTEKQKSVTSQSSEPLSTAKSKSAEGKGGDKTPVRTNASSSASTVETVSEDKDVDEKSLHLRIEELDKKGKAFFKEKKVRS